MGPGGTILLLSLAGIVLFRESPPCPRAGSTRHEIPLSQGFRILWCPGIAAAICGGYDPSFRGALPEPEGGASWSSSCSRCRSRPT